MFLDCHHIWKTCVFHDALQAGKQKEVHRTPLIYLSFDDIHYTIWTTKNVL
jgi:hypothetical protein